MSSTRSPLNGSRSAAHRRASVAGNRRPGLPVLRGVFAEPRSRLRRAKLRGMHPVRVAGLGETVTGIGDERAALRKWSSSAMFAPLADRRVGNPECPREIADFVDGLAVEPRVDLGGVLVGLLGDRQRRVLVDPLRVADHRAQVEPLLGGAASDVHQTVFGGRDPRHGELARIPPGPSEHLEVRDRVIGEPENLHFEHRQVDKLAGAAASAHRDASVAALAYAPARYSPTWPPTNTGARSGDPRPSPTMPPDHACRVNSVAGRSHHGPSSPNGVIDVTVRCG